MPLPSLQQPSAAASSQSSHVVLQMQPDFNTPFPAPESWNRQVGCGKLALLMLCRVGADLSMHWLLMRMAASTDSDTHTLGLHRRYNSDTYPTLHSLHNNKELSYQSSLQLDRIVAQPACKVSPAFKQCHHPHASLAGKCLCPQVSKGEGADIVRVFLQTPTGACHVDITRAILQSHLQVGSQTVAEDM